MIDPKRGTQAAVPRTETPGVVLGLLAGAVALAFWPFGLDQFVLPKQLILLVGVPVVGLVLYVHRGLDGSNELVPDVDKPLAMLVVLYILWSGVAPAWQAQNLRLHLMGSGQLLLTAALAGVSAGVCGGGGAQTIDRLTRLLALPPIVVSVFALGQSFGADPMRLVFDLGSSRPGRWQTLTTLGNPTWTAELIAIAFPIVMVALSPGREEPRPNRWVRVPAALLLAAGVAVTGSRGGMVGLAIGASGLWFFEGSSRVRARRLVGAGLVGLVMLALGAVCSWTAGVGRWGDAEPITGRLALWTAGGHVLHEAPVTGQGLGHTPLVLPGGLEQLVAETDAGLYRWLPTLLVDRLDNDWLQVAVEQGSPAALMLFALWVRAVWLTGRRSSGGGLPIDSAIAASLLVFGFSFSVSAPLHTPATAAYFWVLIGLASCARSDRGAGAGRASGKRWPCFAAAVVFGAATVIAGATALDIHALNAQAGEGHRLLQDGQPGPAAQRLRAPLQRMPWLTAASISRARALVASGRAEEALVVIDDGRQWAESEWFWAVKARALNQLGLPEQARRALDEGLAILPRSPVLLEVRDHSR